MEDLTEDIIKHSRKDCGWEDSNQSDKYTISYASADKIIPTKPLNDTKDEWAEEFDKEFDGKDTPIYLISDEIKAFIFDTIQKEREAADKRNIEFGDKWHKLGWEDGKKEFDSSEYYRAIKKQAVEEYKKELLKWAESQKIIPSGSIFNDGINSGMRYLISYINK